MRFSSGQKGEGIALRIKACQLQEKFKVSSVIVTHDMECAKLTADRIVVLKNGVFTAEGTFDELQKFDDEFVKGFFQ